QYLIERIEEAENVTVQTGASISALIGEESLEKVAVLDSASGTVTEVPARAVFVFIGATPRTDWLKDKLQLDAQGFILSGPDLLREPGRKPEGWLAEREPFWLETSVPGIFVAGDVRRQSTKRIASAVGEGAMAVTFVHQHLRGSAPAQRPPASGG
ncbi:MAG: FAD-dependent oxidoreductase, partial [Devosia sp.]|nr:FAD-dependent oxidoreductase [Devosia sp.]